MAPARIVILRHGEKLGAPESPDDPASPDLSPAGYARAQMLATLIPKKFGPLDYLFAAADSKTSHRPVETVKPLAKIIGFGPDRFDKIYPNNSYAKLADDLLKRPEYAGKLIVICWHHGNIPALGAALGATWAQLATAPELIGRAAPGLGGLKWDPKVFDRFWVLDFGAEEGVKFQSMPQQL
jgi:broad specificity phosphatase PhoE